MASKMEDKQTRLEDSSDDEALASLSDSSGPDHEEEIKTLALDTTHFTRLGIQTDLNRPPTNWLRSSPPFVPPGLSRLSGFDPIHPDERQSPFTSFRMAEEYLYLLSRVDVITSSENVKKLIRAAISDCGLSLIVHRVGNSLLLDAMDIHKYILRPVSQWDWLREFFFNVILKDWPDKNKAVVRNSRTQVDLSRSILTSKFLHHSVNVVRSDPGSGGIEYHRVPLMSPPSRNTRSRNPNSSSSSVFPLLPDPDINMGAFPTPARNLLWNFESLQMLIGSNMPIFGDKEHPCVSLQLQDATKPANVLTGLDYWLDNLMCQVPEIVMCFHIDGMIKNYEVWKTGEILAKYNVQEFDTKVIKDVATNILSFLKNEIKEGHTYWLFKAKNGSEMKLYDLTSLCESLDKDFAKTEDVKEETADQDQSDNPYSKIVAQLLYKLAMKTLREKREQLQMDLPNAKNYKTNEQLERKINKLKRSLENIGGPQQNPNLLFKVEMCEKKINLLRNDLDHFSDVLRSYNHIATTIETILIKRCPVNLEDVRQKVHQALARNHDVEPVIKVLREKLVDQDVITPTWPIPTLNDMAKLEHWDRQVLVDLMNEEQIPVVQTVVDNIEKHIAQVKEALAIIEADPEFVEGKVHKEVVEAVKTKRKEILQEILELQVTQEQIKFNKDAVNNTDVADATIRRLLESCLEVLNKESYPHIACSAHYMLSEIYVPDSLNPTDGTFQQKLVQARQEELEVSEATIVGKGTKKKNKNKPQQQQLPPKTTAEAETQLHKGEEAGAEQSIFSIRLGDLREADAQPDLEQHANLRTEPLPSDILERCHKALEHISLGLENFKNFISKKVELARREERAQEMHERDNPTMSRPMDPIPMPYHEQQQDQQQQQPQSKQPEKEIVQYLHQPEEWHDQLRALLLKKAFLVYITLAETHFSKKRYGSSVRTIKRALNAFFAFDSWFPAAVGERGYILDNDDRKGVRSLLAFAYGVAADCYMLCFEAWTCDRQVDFFEDYNSKGSEADDEIASFIEDILDESQRDWNIRMPSSDEECLNLALKCFSCAMGLYERVAPDSDLLENLKGRMGNALNAAASLYIHKATAIVKAGGSETDVTELISSAAMMLNQGKKHFTDINSTPNVVLLLMNRGMAHRILAQAIKQTASSDNDEKITIPSDRELDQLHTSVVAYKAAFTEGQGKLDSKKFPDKHKLESAALLTYTQHALTWAEEASRTPHMIDPHHGEKMEEERLFEIWRELRDVNNKSKAGSTNFNYKEDVRHTLENRAIMASMEAGIVMFKLSYRLNEYREYIKDSMHDFFDATMFSVETGQVESAVLGLALTLSAMIVNLNQLNNCSQLAVHRKTERSQKDYFVALVLANFFKMCWTMAPKLRNWVLSDLDPRPTSEDSAALEFLTSVFEKFSTRKQGETSVENTAESRAEAVRLFEALDHLRSSLPFSVMWLRSTLLKLLQMVLPPMTRLHEEGTIKDQKAVDTFKKCYATILRADPKDKGWQAFLLQVAEMCETLAAEKKHFLRSLARDLVKEYTSTSSFFGQ